MKLSKLEQICADVRKYLDSQELPDADVEITFNCRSESLTLVTKQTDHVDVSFDMLAAYPKLQIKYEVE